MINEHEIDPFEAVRNPRWVTLSEYARAHGITYFTAYVYMKQGKLPALVREVGDRREYRVDVTHKVARGRGGRPRGAKNKKSREAKQ